MWARTMEVAVGLWLAMSPFVFGHPADAPLYWWNDLLAGAVVVVLALCSFWHRMRRAHLGLLAVATWLVVLGWSMTRGGSHLPAHQNHVVVGILLAMLAIVPTEASRPPTSWRAE